MKQATQKNILVTGSEGYIGSFLCNYLESVGFNVVRHSRSLSDIRDIKQLENDEVYRDVNLVYHLAAKTGVSESWIDSNKYSSVNALGTKEVCEFCLRIRADLIYMSAYVYGDSGGPPIDETFPVEPQNPYSMSKYNGEKWVEYYGATKGLGYTIVRPFNVYGAGQSQMFLIPKIIQQVETAETIVVNDLRPARDYIYIDDLIMALSLLSADSQDQEKYNIGTGTSYRVDQVIQLVQNIWGVNKPVIDKGERRPHEILNCVANIEKFTRKSNWHPTYTLRRGLEKIHRQKILHQ